MREQTDRTSPKNGAKHTTTTPVEQTTTIYIYNLLNSYIVKKVNANNGHNKQETNYSYTSPQLNKRLTVLDIQDKATARPQAKSHAGGDRENKTTRLTDWLSHG